MFTNNHNWLIHENSMKINITFDLPEEACILQNQIKYFVFSVMHVLKKYVL